MQPTVVETNPKTTAGSVRIQIPNTTFSTITVNSVKQQIANEQAKIVASQARIDDWNASLPALEALEQTYLQNNQS